MARVNMDSRKRVNHTVSHLPGVVGSVKAEAQSIGRKAEVRLAAHFYEGESSISVTYGDVDAFVNLDDPDNAMAIEFGHYMTTFKGQKTPRTIRGLYIVTGAAGLI